MFSVKLSRKLSTSLSAEGKAQFIALSFALTLAAISMTKVPSARLIDFTRSTSLDESDLLSLTNSHWSNASIHITENPISEAVAC
ncbi:Polyphenol oxidase II, chloroplastic [Frankliniella fusca]|uniref:Polyphenol oxidase II, chloroplastic n=1 Tax=Frankliniella fusca TaxID=407009 RepID=A0AAE1LKF1_9NEOP|nr:Polyphenol oxidase II, chloroplastic [Frankliniella fusca]